MKTELTIDDICPKEATLLLEALPRQPLTLGKFTLKDRIWVNQEWPGGGIEKVFSEVQVEPLARITWRLLKNKDIFEDDFDKFCEAVVSQKDLYNMIKAVTTTIGISEPLIEKLAESIAPKKTSGTPKKKRR